VTTRRPGPNADPFQRTAATTAATAPAKRPLSFSEEVDLLAKGVQQLKIEFERFFSGSAKLPPEELRNRVQQQLRNLRNASGSSGSTAVDSFRLADLEARFNSYNELFNRRLRDSEEGHRRTRSVSPPPPAESAFNVQKGVVVIGDPAPQMVEALYDGLVAGGEPPRFDLASFGNYIARQASAIREKMGCEGVQFRLVSEDGKVRLKARPIAGSKGP
jgi:hypothetical protein